jgi:tetratricopeptide (TPR) repeat protein
MVGPVIVVLDNFETLWDAPGTQDEVTQVLQTLAQSSNIQLILTMRGNLPPAHDAIQWSQIVPKPLSLSAATELFLAVNPNTQKDEYRDLDQLLRLLDGLPLAIRLLAWQKQLSTCKSLLRRWQYEKTSLLQKNSQHLTHLSSLDISVSMSVKSYIMTSTAEAIQLLMLICHLPHGIKGGAEQLVEMNLGFKNIDRALAAILSAALAEQSADQEIRVLSPIRQYMLSYHNLSEHYISALYQYYICLASKYAKKKIGDDGFHDAMRILLPEMENIVYLFIQDLQLEERSRPGVALAAFNISRFQLQTIPSGEILDIMLKHWPKYSLNIQYGDGLLLQSRIYCQCNQYKQAQEKLEQAHVAFVEIGSRLGAAQSTRSLGDIHRMYYRYNQAREKLDQAHIAFAEIGDRSGAAGCMRSLGDIHYKCNEYAQARQKLEQAHIVFVEIGNRSGAARCMWSLGNTHYKCGEYVQAREKLEQAHIAFVEIGNRSGAAGCMRSLGNIHRVCNEYTQAIAKLEQACIAFVEIGNRSGAAWCMWSLGNIYRICNKYVQATEKLEWAYIAFVEIENRPGAAWCMWSFGNMHSMCNEYIQATEKLEQAYATFVEIENRSGAAWCTFTILHIAFLLL